MITVIDCLSFKCVRMGLGMHVGYGASLAYMNPGFDLSARYRTGRGGTTLFQNLRGGSRKSKKFKVALGCIGSLRPTWNTWETFVSKRCV